MRATAGRLRSRPGSTPTMFSTKPPSSRLWACFGNSTPAPGRTSRLVGTNPGSSGGHRGQRLLGVAQHIAAAPDGFDVVLALGGGGQLLAQLADEDVDDLQLRLVHAAVEVVEEHFLGERGALAQAEQLENAIFLAGAVERLALDLDHAAIEIDQAPPGAYHGFRMTRPPPDDPLDAAHR